MNISCGFYCERYNKSLSLKDCYKFLGTIENHVGAGAAAVIL